MTRMVLPKPPYLARPQPAALPWEVATAWPGQWIAIPAAQPPLVAAYRCRFCLARPETVRIHVTADERYELYLDGRLIGRGSERGDLANWFFETYDLALAAGPHVLAARVWSLGAEHKPWAQQSVRHRFLLAPDAEAHVELLGTGVAAWDGKAVAAYGFVGTPGNGTGSKLTVDGRRFAWGFENGEGDGWAPVTVAGRAFDQANPHLLPGEAILCPARLPPQLSRTFTAGTVRHLEAIDSFDVNATPVLAANTLGAELAGWQAWVSGRPPLRVAPQRKLRAIVDLEGYHTVYPTLRVSGGNGARVRLRWAEHLFSVRGERGSVDVIEGKRFEGIGDEFILDGGAGRLYDTLWWHAGRYLEIAVATADAELCLENLSFEETRYPLSREAEFRASDDRLEAVATTAFRTLQACAHETYVDCPYWSTLR